LGDTFAESKTALASQGNESGGKPVRSTWAVPSAKGT
jgi:hypothetical protein